MKRSTTHSWLEGPADLAEAEVEDVPVDGESVLVRGLSSRYSAEIQSEMKFEEVDGERRAKLDVAEMELLQFHHGVVEPKFTYLQAKTVQEKYGPAFKKVIAKIDELSGIDKEAIEKAEQRFPDGGGRESNGTADAVAAGGGRPVV